MAQLTHTPAAENPAKVRVRKKSTATDMTPMVDLAFLLLAFFMLTTSFNKPAVMQLTMPEQTNDPPPINDENVLNLLLGEDDKIYWWMGLHPLAQSTDYSNQGIRKILLHQRDANPQLMVLIKPDGGARYENVVDILDEMEITNISRYALIKVTEDDRVRISHTFRAGGDRR